MHRRTLPTCHSTTRGSASSSPLNPTLPSRSTGSCRSEVGFMCQTLASCLSCTWTSCIAETRSLQQLLPMQCDVCDGLVVAAYVCHACERACMHVCVCVCVCVWTWENRPPGYDRR
ncbi:hypothetical protein K431DRAFT_59557 [Polychaeton citri CBS 116435]|uniref:Uncharacterized protein n=1 Tax=Polychaeton citri CBS 116435 TaxID=1314669 RepID=A0A9P4Q937_9PEZI|nr:hypothetical protein K431DRAFT_59557 [Polychaeton citri CBS 116435]